MTYKEAGMRFTTTMEHLLELVAAPADCRRRQVGAIIIRAGHVVGRGVNGLPGERSCLAGQCPRGLMGYDQVPARSSYDSPGGQCDAIHAEVAAIQEAGELARGADLHVNYAPCPGCAEAIVEAGLASVTVWADSTGRAWPETP